MSTADTSPLQKYGQLLGRSIKIIDCEVDPDAITISIMNQNMCNKTSDESEHENENSEEEEYDEKSNAVNQESNDENVEETHEVQSPETAGEVPSTSIEQTDVETNEIEADGCVSTKILNKKKKNAMLSTNSDDDMDSNSSSLVENPVLQQAEETPKAAVDPQTNAAYTDESLDQCNSVSQRVSIEKYSADEWKGQTYTAECMQAGYKKITQETHCTFLRKIRGDNYCGLRATIFQCLTQNIKILPSVPLDDLVNIPKTLLKEFGCHWLQEWTFANRIPSTESTKIDILKDCLSYLSEQIRISNSLSDYESRDDHFTAVFNSGTNKEIYLFEALKLLMLYEAVRLHKDNMSGAEVPVFAWLLFARDTSDSPKKLMLQHFNSVGESGGLEQVEMCLLGYTLGVTINVFRPSKCEEEDFISFYPDDQIGKWYNLYLVAEDDRHYNIITE